MRNLVHLVCLVVILLASHYGAYNEGLSDGLRSHVELDEPTQTYTCPPIVVELGEPTQTYSTPDLQHEPLFTPTDLDEVFKNENPYRIRSIFDPEYEPDPEVKRLPPVEDEAEPPKRERGGCTGPVENLCQQHKLPSWYEPVYWGYDDIEPRLVGGGLRPIAKEPGVILSGHPHAMIRVTQYEWNLINLRRAQYYADPLTRLEEQRQDYDMVRMDNHGQVCWWTRNGK